MSTAYAFVDGGYLRRIQDDAMQQLFGIPGDIDFHRFAGSLSQLSQSGQGLLTRTFYYDCVDDVKKPSESDVQFDARVQQQQLFLKMIQSLPGFFVRLGSVTGRRPGRLRQKEVDVLLAVDALEHSFRKNMEVAVLLAGDRDFVPIVESLVRLGTYVHVIYHPASVSAELHEAADVARALNIDHLWGWSTADFQSRCRIPQTQWQDSRADLFPRSVLRVGALPDGREVKIWDANAGLFSLTVYQAAQTDLLNHFDKGILERYASAKYGDIVWK